MRYLEPYIIDDLGQKMVFIGGPRQVGKTTLSLHIAREYFHKYTYLNWDNIEQRKRILGAMYDSESNVIIFDEIHKYKNWKSFVKGEFDVKKEKYAFIITGSARLDIYQKGGDSMLGRYYYYRLHPFSLAEILGINNDFSTGIELHFGESFYPSKLQELLDFGGFPEVFAKKEKRNLERWKKDRVKRIIQEDIRDISQIKEISLLEILVSILHTKVGNLLSINSLVEDIQVTNKTLTNWMEILEKVYYCYRVYPFANSAIKSIKKEPKLYLWDYTEVRDEGNKNENLIANHLLKWVHFLEDVYGYQITLQYLRDKEQREVDFVIVFKGKIQYLIEVKTSDTSISRSLLYFKEKLGVEKCFQIVFGDKEIDVEKSGVRVISASKFLAALV